MKIGTGEIFDIFNRDLVEKKKYLLSSKENYENSKSYIIQKLSNYKHYLENFTNINFKYIKNLDRYISEKSLIHLAQLPDVSIDTIRRNLNVIVEINRSLEKLNLEIEQVISNEIDENVFRNIIASFDNKLADEIVYKGYTFKIGRGLGVIRIKRILCDKRIKKRINWNESNKRKKEILDEGGIPFKVLTRDENRKCLTHNDGIRWFVYFEGDFDYLWHWSKNRNIVLNSAYYKFRPTIYNNTSKGGTIGNVNKLSHLKTSNSELLKNFY